MSKFAVGDHVVLSQNFVLVKCALSLGTIMLRALQ